jgi:hypothetical protein
MLLDKRTRTRAVNTLKARLAGCTDQALCEACYAAPRK